MNAPLPPTIPKKSSAAYKVARLIYDTGSKTDAELSAAVESLCLPQVQLSLEGAIASGWLRRLPDGRVALTDFTVDFFDTEPGKFVGQVAGPDQINRMNRKPYVQPRRLPRDDEPEWSVRIGTTFYTQA